jgi:hypothetical protein
MGIYNRIAFDNALSGYPPGHHPEGNRIFCPDAMKCRRHGIQSNPPKMVGFFVLRRHNEPNSDHVHM